MTTSIALDVLPELLVLVALEFDEILVDDEALIDSDGPRLRIRLGIFERQVDLQVVVCRTADLFRELRLLRIRTPIHVNPAVIRAVFGAPQVVCFDDQRIAVPMANRVAVPPRLRLALRRKFPPIHINVAQAVIRFILDQDHFRIRDVHDPARLGLLVKLQEAHWQTIGVGIVTGLSISPLFPNVPGPFGIRQPAFHVRASLEECGYRWAFRIVGERWGRRLKPKTTTTARGDASLRSVTMPAAA